MKVVSEYMMTEFQNFNLRLHFTFNVPPLIIKINACSWFRNKTSIQLKKNAPETLTHNLQYSMVQEIQHILFGQLLFCLVFLPYSTCCQKLCSTVFYSFCKVLKKSKHPCCRLQLTRLVLTVCAVSFFLHPTVLSAEVRLVWLVMARCEETAEGGEKIEKRRERGMKEEEREWGWEIYSACQFVVLSDTCPTAFWWFVPRFTFLLRGCCSFLVWEADVCVHSCVCVCVFVRNSGQNCEP